MIRAWHIPGYLGNASLSDFVQSQTRRVFSGVGPEGGVANVCGLTGRAQGLGALRPPSVR